MSQIGEAICQKIALGGCRIHLLFLHYLFTYPTRLSSGSININFNIMKKNKKNFEMEGFHFRSTCFKSIFFVGHTYIWIAVFIHPGHPKIPWNCPGFVLPKWRSFWLSQRRPTCRPCWIRSRLERLTLMVASSEATRSHRFIVYSLQYWFSRHVFIWPNMEIEELKQLVYWTWQRTHRLFLSWCVCVIVCKKKIIIIS